MVECSITRRMAKKSGSELPKYFVMNFKQWLEEDFTQAKTLGNEKMALNMANRAITQNPKFTQNMAHASNAREKMNYISRLTSKTIDRNKNAVRSHGLQPAVVSNQIAKAGGVEDYKGMFMKKGMKKK